MLCMGRTYAAKRRTIPNYGRATFLNARQRCRIEPDTCIIVVKCGTTENIYTQIFKSQRIFLSIETDVPPVQINSELS
jgi:hypothetical protein